jgi:anhydro-N-acetylmuramic acid kinase
MSKILALGMMSGTSLDGLDIVLSEFWISSSGWNYEIIQATTVPYDDHWQRRLAEAHRLDAVNFWKTHVEYGHYLGRQAREFLETTGLSPSVIASHGHTVFHQPGSGFTAQIGAGDAIAAETGFPVVTDLRSVDVALGGQGAPLVPMGDRLLFGQYGACMNIGGFTNVSFEQNNERIAFDICPSNIVLNQLAARSGKKFDPEGILASHGRLQPSILDRIRKIPYYSLEPPKSLGREWLENEFLPLFYMESYSVADLLRTMVEHIGQQVGQSIDILNKTDILVTGGGAHNRFLVDVIRNYSKHEFIVPAPDLVDYKEALVFALLGVLRMLRKINVFSSVTGSKSDHCGGALYEPGPL